MRGAVGFRTGGDGGEAGAAARTGGACGGARLEARQLLLQGGHGEEQAVRRAAPHRREGPGALEAALLHPSRKVNCTCLSLGVVGYCFDCPIVCCCVVSRDLFVRVVNGNGLCSH